MQQPLLRKLRILELRQTRATSGGNTYLECLTDAGLVAFWGRGAELTNIRLVQGCRLPATLRCGTRPSPWDQHALWVPQHAEVSLVQESPLADTPGPNLIEI